MINIWWEIRNFINKIFKLRGKCSSCGMYYVEYKYERRKGIHKEGFYECECCGDIQHIV